MAGSPCKSPDGVGEDVHQHVSSPSVSRGSADSTHPQAPIPNRLQSWGCLPLVDEFGSPLRVSLDGSIHKIWNFAELDAALNAIEDAEEAPAFQPIGTATQADHQSDPDSAKLAVSSNDLAQSPTTFRRHNAHPISLTSCDGSADTQHT